MISSLGAVRLYFHKTASEEPLKVMRNKALFVAEFFSDICCAMRLFEQEVDNIPPRLISKRLEKEFMGLVEINTLHGMNYNSYLSTTQVFVLWKP